MARHIDRELQAEGGPLYRSISVNPVAWAPFALRLKSRVMLQEAIVHIVGQWRSLSDMQRVELPEEIRLVCVAKDNELQVKKIAIETKIASYYPWQLIDGPVTSHHLSSARQSGLYFWQAISLYRHWFAQALAEPGGSLAPDGGASLYRQICQGGFHYLGRPVIGQFLQYFGIEGRRLTEFDHCLSMIKEGVKGYAVEMLVNNSRIDTNMYPLPYLTCCVVRRRDMPWEDDEASDRDDDDDDRMSPSPDRTISDQESSSQDDESDESHTGDTTEEAAEKDESHTGDTTEEEDWNDGRYAKKQKVESPKKGKGKAPEKGKSAATQKAKSASPQKSKGKAPQKEKSASPQKRKVTTPKTPKAASPKKRKVQTC